MVDYSKWDKLCDELSDESDNEDVHVTRFDEPQSITIGGNNPSFLPSNSSNLNEEIIQEDNKIKENKQSKIIELDPDDVMERITENGGQDEWYYWSQTSQEVVIKFKVREDCRGRDIAISLKDKSIQISNPTIDYKFEGVLEGDVDLGDGELSGEDLDWEMEDEMSLSYPRLLSLTLPKKHPDPSIIHWWARCMEGGVETDLELVEGRRGSSKFSENWEEANRLFQLEMEKRKKNNKEEEEEEKNS